MHKLREQWQREKQAPRRARKGTRNSVMAGLEEVGYFSLCPNTGPGTYFWHRVIT